MKTLLATVELISCIMSTSINFYFLLSHDDLNKGIMEPAELTN